MSQAAVEPDEVFRRDSFDLVPGYAAPELLEKGGGRVHDSSDQYSLAMTYVKLRTGTLPFEHTQSRRIVEEQLSGKLNLKSLPERERDVIAKAASRNPQARYPSCVALIDALEAVCEQEVLIEPPEQSPKDEAPTQPGTHGPKYGGPTPAHGLPHVPGWRRQGGLGTDRTLIPGQEPTLDRVEMPVVDAKKEEPAAPIRSEPKLKPPTPSSGWAIKVAVIVAGLVGTGLSPSPLLFVIRRPRH
jgi:serine/threonine protein kinase